MTTRQRTARAVEWFVYVAGVAAAIWLLTILARAAAPTKPVKPSSFQKYDDPLKGIVYYKHPQTGKLALYVAYELEPGNLYRFEVTDDGVNFETIEVLSTAGNTNDIYESFNVPDPCQGIWPRVVNLGPSP